MAAAHAAQSHNRHIRLPCDDRKSRRTQRSRAGMGAGREQGRQENEIDTPPLGATQLGQIMNRRAMDHAARRMPLLDRPVNAVRAPLACLGRLTRQQQQQPLPVGNAPERIEQAPALGQGRCMMPQDDAAAPRQPLGGGDQVRWADALVAEEPECRHRS